MATCTLIFSTTVFAEDQSSTLTAETSIPSQIVHEQAGDVAPPPNITLASNPLRKPKHAVKPAPLLKIVFDDPITPPHERVNLKIFHGRWGQLNPDSLTPTQQAYLDLYQYNFTAESLQNPSITPQLRAHAALLRHDPKAALDILNNTNNLQADQYRASALLMQGKTAEATELLRGHRDRLQKNRTLAELTEPDDIIAAVKMLTQLAELEGRPPRDWQAALNTLTDIHQNTDPLYWPARLAEAELLYQKNNRKQAIEALLETLAYNPKASRAWYLLGLMSAESFGFDRAGQATEQLRMINPNHPLAAVLETRIALVQRDSNQAIDVLNTALEKHPQHHTLLALKAAAHATAFEDQNTTATLAQLEAISPGSHLGYLESGRYLALARQYDLAADMLRLAIDRAPNSAETHTELGLLLVQKGDLPAAHNTLQTAAALDPFNDRTVNSLTLVETLLSYETFETDHFIIRYKPGIDEVLARDIKSQIESIYRTVTTKFQHEPTVKTQIDILPDEQHFGVRITGMPEIWTVAAATGDVIALTPPRAGAKQRGNFDWHNVLRHEFVHTVTLSQTSNRIPHWLTEACAVSTERLPRDYNTAQLLAWAYQEDKLFNYDNINWGFVRPKNEYDRPLAYAQAHWMLTYLTETYSHQSLIDLLSLYKNGTPDVQGLKQITGLSPQQFMTNFNKWANTQIISWGLASHPDDQAIHQLLANQPHLAPDQIATYLDQYPDHPDLIKLYIEKRYIQVAKADEVNPQDRMSLIAYLQQYQQIRPVDPWPNRLLADLSLQNDDLGMAIKQLSVIDDHTADSGSWAMQIAKLHRNQSNAKHAYTAAIRALHREPYNPEYRQYAATLALQNKHFPAALHHLRMMPILEPKQAVHHIRLAALYHRLEKYDHADAAARSALTLNAKAPVTSFLIKENAAPLPTVQPPDTEQSQAKPQ
ncbi:peptidase MA family metallohydrolase [Poriferisphaera sp. WC338]|uniref:tetratricopeptide repeat protein n=1 Tax=Poriferisphaera sp. WC338 TaxID=3425129 RepID=UPI003D81A41D